MSDTRRRYRRHVFAPSLRTELRRLYRLDNWHGPVALLLDWLVLATAVFAVLSVSWWLYPVAVVLIGSRQRALATLVHEAAHGTLARSRWLANAIATVPAGYAIFMTMSAYRESHVKMHHGRFGDPTRDPDYRYMIDQGVYADDLTREDFVRRQIVAPLLLLRLPSYLWTLVQERLFVRQGRRSEMGLLLVYWVVLVAATIALGWWPYLLAFWLVPYFTSFQIIGWFIEVAEHAPLMTNDVDLYMARNRNSHWFEAFLTAMHNERYHLLHHLAPRIPYWNMPRAHAICLEDPDYAEHDRRSGGIFASSNGAPAIIGTLGSRV